MPSLKDLAKECGVSVATVSKALNDQPDISPATRERVRAAAHRKGYMPNAAARSLSRGRTSHFRKIILLHPLNQKPGFPRNPNYCAATVSYVNSFHF